MWSSTLQGQYFQSLLGHCVSFFILRKDYFKHRAHLCGCLSAPVVGTRFSTICTHFSVPLHRTLRWTLWEEASARDALLSNVYSVPKHRDHPVRSALNCCLERHWDNSWPSSASTSRKIPPNKVKISAEESTHKQAFEMIKCVFWESMTKQILFASYGFKTDLRLQCIISSKATKPLLKDKAPCLTEHSNLPRVDKHKGNRKERLLVILMNRFSIIKSIMSH